MAFKHFSNEGEQVAAPSSSQTYSMATLAFQVQGQILVLRIDWVYSFWHFLEQVCQGSHWMRQVEPAFLTSWLQPILSLRLHLQSFFSFHGAALQALLLSPYCPIQSTELFDHSELALQDDELFLNRCLPSFCQGASFAFGLFRYSASESQASFGIVFPIHSCWWANCTVVQLR